MLTFISSTSFDLVIKSVSTTVTPTVTKPITVTQTVEVDVTLFGTQYTLGDGTGSGSGKVKQNISLLQVKVNKVSEPSFENCKIMLLSDPPPF